MTHLLSWYRILYKTSSIVSCISFKIGEWPIGSEPFRFPLYVNAYFKLCLKLYKNPSLLWFIFLNAQIIKKPTDIFAINHIIKCGREWKELFVLCSCVLRLKVSRSSFSIRFFYFSCEDKSSADFFESSNNKLDHWGRHGRIPDVRLHLNSLDLPYYL